MQGCAETVYEINSEINDSFDIICCACGTGATLAGLVTAMEPTQKAIGFSVLKGGEFLNREVTDFLNLEKTGTNVSTKNWHIETGFHFGGYAKINDELIQFMSEFQKQYGFSLDAVYTGKMFYGLFELMKSRTFKPGTTIIAIHSGGLQGNKGFNL